MCGFEITVASSFHRIIVKESIIYIERVLLKRQNVRLSEQKTVLSTYSSIFASIFNSKLKQFT